MAKSRTVLMAAAMGCLVIAGIGWAYADDAGDHLAKAPAAVAATVKALVGDNKISDFDSDNDGGKTVYELEYSIKGVEYASDISPSGEILTREVSIDLSVVPPVVVDAAKKAHPDCKLTEPTIVTAGDKMFYELETKIGKDSHEMQISAAGVMLADAVEAPEAGEGDGKKEDKD